MANISRMSKNVYKFQLWNVSYTWNNQLDNSLDGHYTIFWNRYTDEYLVYKHGNFGGLTYYIDTNNQEFENDKISPHCMEWIKGEVQEMWKNSVTWEDHYNNHKYASNIIFDYDYTLFEDLTTKIGRIAVSMLEKNN
jgi:hypothetical protein